MSTETPVVLQLGSLISDSLSTLSSLCSANGLSLPDPADSVLSEESEAFRKFPEAAHVANVIAAAALQLAAALLPPKQSLFHLVSGPLKAAAVRTAIGCHVPEILREAGPEGLHVDEVAAKSKVDSTKLARLLRLLANHHVFREVSPDVFANTRISAVLDTGKEVKDLVENPNAKHDDTSGFVALAEHFVNPTPIAAAHMLEVIRSPKSHSQEPTDAPFHFAHRTFGVPPRTSLYKWFDLPQNAYAQRRFGLAMRGLASMQPADAVLDAYAWDTLPPQSVVVDVGAGIGTSAMLIAQAFPHLRLVVQDTPKVIQDAKRHWKNSYPEAIEEGRVEFQEVDFFQPQPPLPASFGTTTSRPAVYLLKNILHNWSNKYSNRILSRLRARSGDNTQLLVIGTIMANLCREDSTSSKGSLVQEVGAQYEEAPRPLLPNYGAANEMAYTIDITMLTTHNAQERTLPEMHSLLQSSGWDLKRAKRSNPPNNFFDPVIASPIFPVSTN